MVGCANKWSIVPTPSGLYFTDNNEKEIYLLGNEVSNISAPMGFSSWSKKNIAASNVRWTPLFPEVNGQSAIKSFYDKVNREVLFVSSDSCLAYSEKFGVFTSFYSYTNVPFFCNLDDTGIWIKGNSLWKHQGASTYGKFFGVNQPYWMTIVANPEPLADKIFTNLEFRACVSGEGDNRVDVFNDSFDNSFHPVDNRYMPYLPFDYLETWNEYQHGYAVLSYKNGRGSLMHHLNDGTAHLDRKFRIWRCDIPRDNYKYSRTNPFDFNFDNTFQAPIRKAHPIDRMRNPWLFVKLRKDSAHIGEALMKAEMHDMVATYYI